MNVLLNFFPLSVGGGQQVASNFLKIISSNRYGHNWYVLVGTGSELDSLANDLFPSENILSIKYDYFNRLFRNGDIRRFIEENEIDIVYNYTTVIPNIKVPQVVRSVYSNLYFPELRFWDDYSFFGRTKRKVIDCFRLKGTLKADGIIFENYSMLERAQSLYSYPARNTVYVEPSVTYFDETQTIPQYEYLNNIDHFKILYLSSWALHKNIHLLPEVARILKDRRRLVKFVLSLDPSNSTVNNALVSRINHLDVKEYFEFIGKVKAVHVHQVVKACNAIILLSKLECFSSNVIEAYHFGRPLIISDEMWAKSACESAAIYVKRDDAKDVANNILKLIDQRDFRRNLIHLGMDRLKQFNSPQEKVIKQIKFLEKIYDNSTAI